MKPGMYSSWRSCAKSLGPLLIISAVGITFCYLAWLEAAR